jgi:hypothetical protein
MLKNDGEVRTIDDREGVIQYCYEGTDIWSVLLTGGFARDYCGWQLTPIVKCYRVYEQDGPCWHRHWNLKTGDCEKGSFCEYQQPREAKVKPACDQGTGNGEMCGAKHLPVGPGRYCQDCGHLMAADCHLKPESPPQLFICEGAERCKARSCLKHWEPHAKRPSCDSPCGGANGAIKDARCIPIKPEAEEEEKGPRIEVMGPEPKWDDDRDCWYQRFEIRWQGGK